MISRPPLKYPIGIQTFSKIREGGYAYIDKTQFIGRLVSNDGYYFLSRPRRFGKSLFLSTLHAYFEGCRELFKGLALDTMDVDWTPSPVLHFDFNAEDYSQPTGLHIILNRLLDEYEKQYGMTDIAESIAGRFAQLIRRIAEETGRKVVILIDEYDKPLLALEDKPEEYEKNLRLLKSFFGNLKSMDRYIRFAFLTGVARFSKVSIFSDLNNLKDISLNDTYADICGLTEAELTEAFKPAIESLANKRKSDYHTILKALRDYYDGYMFSAEGSRLYNPYSVMRALDDQTFDPFWFGTGSPRFLVERIRKNKIDPSDINGRMCSKRELMEVGMDSRDPIPLMFQTGYLTIDYYDSERERYALRFPNREVEIAFAEDLLPMYNREVRDSSSPFSIFKFQDDLNEGHPEEFMNRLAILFKDMPSEDRGEGVYRAVTYLICKLCSMTTQAEHHSLRGRSDLEVITRGYIYVFEFKYDRSVKEAMDQIYLRDYMGRYALDSRPVYLIGVNYDSSKKNRGLSYEVRPGAGVG